MLTLEGQLRQAIVQTGELQHVIAHECGLTPSSLSRFLRGKGGLSLDAAGRIAAYLKLVLVPAERSHVAVLTRSKAGGSTLP